MTIPITPYYKISAGMIKKYLSLVVLLVFCAKCTPQNTQSNEEVDSTSNVIEFTMTTNNPKHTGYWLNPNPIDYDSLDKYEEDTRNILAVAQTVIESRRSSSSAVEYSYSVNEIPLIQTLRDYRLAYGYAIDNELSVIYLRYETTGPDITPSSITIRIEKFTNTIVATLESKDPIFLYLKYIWGRNNDKIRSDSNLSSSPIIATICEPCYLPSGLFRKIDVFCVGKNIERLSLDDKKKLAKSVVR